MQSVATANSSSSTIRSRHEQDPSKSQPSVLAVSVSKNSKAVPSPPLSSNLTPAIHDSLNSFSESKFEGELPELNPNGIPICEEQEGPSVMLSSLETFTYIEDNQYIADGLSLQEESMKCLCDFIPDSDPIEKACGEDCINRALFIECLAKNCPVGDHCQNRRFQKREYAPIEVFLTRNKGHGIKAKQSLAPNTFVIEYIGEVVSLAEFRRRTQIYEEQGQKHMYFMSLKVDQVIDATRRGGLARFINHSCDPNCVLQKWVVGKRLRMGIFTKKAIAAGEELTFDYKFVRYGAPAQVCLCGTAKCKGTIGITKSPHAPKTASSNSPGSPDEEELLFDEEQQQLNAQKEGLGIDKQQSKGISDIDSVTAYVKKFLQLSENPSRVNNMLDKLLETESTAILRRFVQMHGLVLLRRCLSSFKDNSPICRKTLSALQKLPINTRNTIDDYELTQVLTPFVDHKDPIIDVTSRKLIEDWGNLDRVYRIPKAAKKNSVSSASESTELNQASTSKRAQEDSSDEKDVPEKRQRSNSQTNNNSGDVASNFSSNFSPRYSGDSNRNSYRPSNSFARRDSSFRSPDGDRNSQSRHNSSERSDFQKQPFREPTKPLPAGWQYAHSTNGDIYYYNSVLDKTQWTFPEEVPPASSAVASSNPVTDINPQEIVQKMTEAARIAVETARKEEESKSKRDNTSTNSSNSKEKIKTSSSGSSKKSSSSKSKTKTPEKDSPKVVALEDIKTELKDELASLVIKYFSKYKGSMTPEDFKKHARKITHALLEKVSRENKETLQINDELKRKVKKFVDGYAEKLQKRS